MIRPPVHQNTRSASSPFIRAHPRPSVVPNPHNINRRNDHTLTFVYFVSFVVSKTRLRGNFARPVIRPPFNQDTRPSSSPFIRGDPSPSVVPNPRPHQSSQQPHPHFRVIRVFRGFKNSGSEETSPARDSTYRRPSSPTRHGPGWTQRALAVACRPRCTQLTHPGLNGPTRDTGRTSALRAAACPVSDAKSAQPYDYH